jgi:methylthioribose-1-phosphate isomerase
MRTVYWDYESNTVKLIDQRKLPFVYEVAEFADYHDVARSISEMYVRGAPAIGATAAFGMALAARQSSATMKPGLMQDLEEAASILNAARPTAVNLSWAITQQLLLAGDDKYQSVAEIHQALLQLAQ